MFPKRSLLAAVVAAVAVGAQQGAWQQCGGKNWSGETACVCGTACTVVNDFFSQCIPGAEAPEPTITVTETVTTTATVTDVQTVTVTSAPQSTPSAPSGDICPGTRTKFQFFGVNQSGAEFGNANIPGTLNKDYTWPSTDSVDFFMAKGFNTFRITFLMERLTPPATGLTGPFDADYLSGLTSIANYITNKGGFAVIDPHNFMRFNGEVISSTDDFQAFWANLAAVFKDNANIIFDIQNEPHDIVASTVLSLNQAAVNGIRAAGATTQLILAEGTSWTGAWTWTSSGNSAVFGQLKDPFNNTAIEMHQYLDSDGSGTNGTCVSPTIGAERLVSATNWLKNNGIRGFLGEFGGGANADCISAIQGMLCSMQQSGVWIGALWWAAGPWWGDYFLSIEPPSGPAVAQILPEALEPFL